MIAAAFYPKDVIVRLSDFKTNEYANLVGGSDYEPTEENPMLGFRGASRYYDPRYQAGFALECRAMKKVRDEMGLTNLKLMIPFCRTVEEGRRVLAEMAKHGLVRGEDGLGSLCDVRNSQQRDSRRRIRRNLRRLLDRLERPDAADAGRRSRFGNRRASLRRAKSGRESDDRQVIAACRAKGRKIGICGQAPSDYPEFAQFLVEQGIDSISLNPDTVLKTTLAILEKERSKQ